MTNQNAIQQSVETSTLTDILERVLDKGIVIAGDIRISLCDVELLTVQLRLVICSVEKAREMGMDWWVNNPAFCSGVHSQHHTNSIIDIEKRLTRLETASNAE